VHAGRACRQKRYIAWPAGTHSSISEALGQAAKDENGGGSRFGVAPCVCVPVAGGAKTIGLSELLETVSGVVQNHFVKIGRKFYRQRVGISQGKKEKRVIASVSAESSDFSVDRGRSSILIHD